METCGVQVAIIDSSCTSNTSTLETLFKVYCLAVICTKVPQVQEDSILVDRFVSFCFGLLNYQANACTRMHASGMPQDS